jgi:hypothetical protein
MHPSQIDRHDQIVKEFHRKATDVQMSAEFRKLPPDQQAAFLEKMREDVQSELKQLCQ